MDFYTVNAQRQVYEIIAERKIPLQLNVLVSIFYMDASTHKYLMQYKKTGLIKKMALDSGTFSLNKKFQGRDDLQALQDRLFMKFLEYAKCHNKMYDMILNFDVDYTLHGYEKNLAYLEKLHFHGIDAWPVIHDPIGKDYVKYISLGYTKFAIGQFENRDFKAISDLLLDLMSYGISTVHLLGGVAPTILPFTLQSSADASSATIFAAYGTAKFWIDGEFGFPIPMQIHINKPDEPECTMPVYRQRKEQLMAWLESQDARITWEDLRGPKRTYFITIVNLIFFNHLAEITTINQSKLKNILVTGKAS